jgi:hypothetical protein
VLGKSKLDNSGGEPNLKASILKDELPEKQSATITVKYNLSWFYAVELVRAFES